MDENEIKFGNWRILFHGNKYHQLYRVFYKNEEIDDVLNVKIETGLGNLGIITIKARGKRE